MVATLPHFILPLYTAKLQKGIFEGSGRVSQDMPDKKALLNELRLDRDATPAGEGGKALKWAAMAAVIGGVGFALWAFDISGSYFSEGSSAIPIKQHSRAQPPRNPLVQVCSMPPGTWWQDVRQQ